MNKIRFINKLLGLSGYVIVNKKWLATTKGKIKKQIIQETPPQHFIDGVLSTLLVKSKPLLRIVQVGAFDGISGDPIHRFLVENKYTTEALLIEPQKSHLKIVLKIIQVIQI